MSTNPLLAFNVAPKKDGWSNSKMYSVDFTNAKFSNSKTGRYFQFARFCKNFVEFTTGTTVYTAENHEQNPIFQCTYDEWISMSPRPVCCVNKMCSCKERAA